MTVRGFGDPLQWLARWHHETQRRFPSAGMIGYIAYELAYPLLGLGWRESVSHETFRYPLIQFLVYERLDECDPIPFGRGLPSARAYDRDASRALIERPSVRAVTDPSRYRDGVLRIKAHIEAGDIYQANYTQAFDVVTALSPSEVAAKIGAINPAPYSAHLSFGPVAVAGVGEYRSTSPAIDIIASTPELFWRKRGSEVETRPIKGTVGRSDDPKVDRANLRRLLASPKDQAELLMITDLERNDLGKVAQVGSVRTRMLRRPRAAPSVWHLESTVTGTVDADCDWTDVMRAVFPGGSITGAPKRRAVEILRDLEPVARGAYCGAIGWVDADGDAEFALGIRTIVQIGSVVRVFGGGGIVADSDPESEYDESLVKIAPILDALTRDEAGQPSSGHQSALTAARSW